jgi:hypothetical protein
MKIDDYVKKSQSTIRYDIFMAGDISQAKQVCREYCEVGLCITIEPVDFIYTGGEEVGFKIGLINYPRFPTNHNQIRNHAIALGHEIRTRLCQNSFLVIGPDYTEWYSRPLLDVEQKESK